MEALSECLHAVCAYTMYVLIDLVPLPAATEWRGKNEMISLLEAGIPYTQRGAGGADVWPLQLRDNWTRYVPLGNIFSGLFVEIKERNTAGQSA